MVENQFGLNLCFLIPHILNYVTLIKAMAIEPPRIDIGHVIRNAALFNPRKELVSSMEPDSLNVSVKRLFALLRSRQIEYLLVGGVALLSYVEGRNTEDLDLIMVTSTLKKLPEIHLSSQEQYFARGEFEGLKIDILLTRNPLFARVIRRHATTRSFLDGEIPTATVAGLLLLKLYALPSLHRQGDFTRVSLYENDIAVLLYQYQPEMTPLIKELSKYVTGGDLEEIKKISDEIQRRIDTFRNQSSSKKE